MTGSNLPPGVSEHMIPGNRPEDMLEEAFWEELGNKLEQEGISSVGPLPAAPSANFVSLDDLWDDTSFVKILTVARDMGYQRGFAEGADDVSAALSAQMLDKQENFQATDVWSKLRRAELDGAKDITLTARQISDLLNDKQRVESS